MGRTSERSRDEGRSKLAKSELKASEAGRKSSEQKTASAAKANGKGAVKANGKGNKKYATKAAKAAKAVAKGAKAIAKGAKAIGKASAKKAKSGEKRKSKEALRKVDSAQSVSTNEDSEVGAWDPAAKSIKISEVFLQRCLEFCDKYGNRERWEELPNFLTEVERRECAGIMRLPLEKWQAISVDFESEKLTALIRFFTVAEVVIPDCRCGDTSPVIALAWRLRSMDGCMERQLLEWIREHSDNRYLPYGPLY